MKKIIMIIVTISLFSCESKNVIVNSSNADNIPMINGKMINTYIIDSCEYIGSIYGGDSDILVHKGNCKFCIERKKKQDGK